MKITTFILMIALAQVSAATFAQKLTFVKKGTSLEEVFNAIKLQTGYNVLYSPAKINDRKKIDVSFKNSDLKDVLEELTKSGDFGFTIDEKNISLKPKSASLLDKLSTVISNIVRDLIVKGRVTDQDGKPLPNASIRVKGKSAVTNTNAEGLFEIKGVEDDAVLLVSYVGFKTLEIPLQGAVLPLEIKLNVATGELEEVKVVYNTGYQELNKERATGSFVHIDNELFNRRVGATVLERIYDLVPGLLRNEKNSDPLGFSIRGTSTINANKRPLLVVDNFIYEGDPNDLNPNDVENITILKDAAAASIWGARAGNGVVVITTKKGRLNSTPVVTFNTNLTIAEKPNLFSIPAVSSTDVIALERKRFADGYYDAKLNDKFSYPELSQVVEILAKQRAGTITPADANGQIAVYENHDVRNDINKYLLQSGLAQQYALNISGGMDKYRYYGAVGYDKNRPNDINIKNERLTIGFNNSWNPIKNLQLNAQLNWSQSENKNKNKLGGYGNVLINPYLHLASEDGNALAIPYKYRITYLDTVSFPGKLDWMYRPLQEAQNGNQSSKNYNIRITGSANYTIVQGLKVDLGYYWQSKTSDNTVIDGINTFSTTDLINQFIQKGTNNLTVYPYPLGGIYNQSNSHQTSWALRGGLSFNHSFGKHEITSILGVERNHNNSRTFIAPTQFGYNSETNVFSVPQFGNWVTRPTGSTITIGPAIATLRGTLIRFGSYFGNVGYTYHQKYTFTASGRIDESNFFGVEANDRKKPLWSAGFKWNIAKENFYKINQLPILTLRATYGYNGNVNAGTSPLATASYQGIGTLTFLPFAQISTPPNPELRWENVRNVDVGIDFGIKNQRVSGNFDFYHKRGEDLISGITVDPTSGFTTYTGNSSSVQTKGIDMGLNTKNLDGIFKWYTSFNFAFQKDRVVVYTVDPPKQGQLSGVFVGKPLSSIYSYRWAGLNPLNGDSRFYVKDQVVGSNLLGSKISQSDLVYNGQSNPPIFGSFFNNFSFKNISISVGIGYEFGHYFRRQSFTGSFLSSSLFQHEDYLNAWKNPGDELNTNIPGYLESYPDARYQYYPGADILVEKADHIRLRDVRLTYSLNKSSIKVLPFKSVALYLYANNLGIIWKASKYNPDTGNGLIAITPKTIAIGLNINF